MSKLPWEEFPEIWPTKAKFMAFLRGGIRRGLWEKYPVKLEFLEQQTVLIKNTNPRSKKRFPFVKALKCSQCEETKKKDECEVDHIKGNVPLRTMDDVRQFIEAMLFVGFEDLTILCKECHYIKSYAEKHNMSFEEARIEKQVIKICKGSAAKVKKWLEENGYTGTAKNAKQRREAVREVLKGKYNVS